MGTLATRLIALKHRLHTTVDFSEVRQLCEGIRIAKGNKVHAVMSEGREACNDSCLLATTDATGRDEHSSGHAGQGARLPEVASRVQESLQKKKKASSSPTNTKRKVEDIYLYTYLDLSRHAAVASGDTKNNTVVFSEVGGGYDRIVGLGGRMHLVQDILGKSLGNPRFR